MTRAITPQTVLVLGASGRFGRIAELLLERGHRVRAGIRNPQSPAAVRLQAMGAELVEADFDDPASLETAAFRADSVFATGTAHRAGPGGEELHGRNLVAALTRTGAPYLVFVSGDGAAPDSPVPLFRVKWEVEEAIRASGVQYTILTPTYLMENLFNPWNIPALQAGVLPSPIPVDRSLQQTAVADLLSLAMLAIERPDRFAGRRIPIASDELTAGDSAAAISELIPRALDARQPPSDALPPGVRVLFGWLESVGHHVDTGALHDEFPAVAWHDYGGWVHMQLDRFRELCEHPEPVAG
jgi:uncharacterized protein YbjT (DUF2867 family)